MVWIGRGRPDGWIRAHAVACGRCIPGICGCRDGRWRGHGRLVWRRGLGPNGRFGVGAPSSVVTVILANGGLSALAKVNVVHAPLEVVHGIRISPIRGMTGTGIASSVPLTSLAVFIFLNTFGLFLLFVDPPFLILLPTNPVSESTYQRLNVGPRTIPSGPCHPYWNSLEPKMTRSPD